MLIEVFALKLDNMPDQQFSIRSGHSDEAAMEAIRIERIGDGIHTQYLKMGFKEHLARKKQGTGENGVHLEGLVQCDANSASAEIDGSLNERSLRGVVLRLKTHGQENSDAIVVATLST